MKVNEAKSNQTLTYEERALVSTPWKTSRSRVHGTTNSSHTCYQGGNETQVSLVKGEWCHHCANIPMEKYPLFSRTLPSPPKRECVYTNATFFSQKYWTLVVGSNSWPVNHESCHLAVLCPRRNILPWLRLWHCTKNKRASFAFWTELSYPSFCPGRDLGPGPVNW